MGRDAGRVCIVTGAARGTGCAIAVPGIGCITGPQDAARPMIAQGGGGRTINTAWIASRQVSGSVAAICVAKRAAVSLTQAGARNLAKRGITVTVVAPGMVATEIRAQIDRARMETGAAAQRPGRAMEAFSAEIPRAAS